MANRQVLKRNRIPSTTAIFMISAAIFVDGLQFFLAFIPFVGWTISSFISIAAWIGFYTWNKYNGSLVSGQNKKLLINVILPLIELIPFVGDVLPTWTVDVCVNIFYIRAEDMAYNHRRLSRLAQIANARASRTKIQRPPQRTPQISAVGAEIKPTETTKTKETKVGASPVSRAEQAANPQNPLEYEEKQVATPSNQKAPPKTETTASPQANQKTIPTEETEGMEERKASDTLEGQRGASDTNQSGTRFGTPEWLKYDREQASKAGTIDDQELVDSEEKAEFENSPSTNTKDLKDQYREPTDAD